MREIFLLQYHYLYTSDCHKSFSTLAKESTNYCKKYIALIDYTVSDCIIILGRRIYMLHFSGGCWLGQREWHSHRTRTHATRMQHAGNSFSTRRTS